MDERLFHIYGVAHVKRKALFIVAAVFLLAALWYGVTYKNGSTIAEVCGLGGKTQIVSVEMIPASPDTFRGTHTVYDSGEVYDRAVSLFDQSRFSGKKLDGFLTVGIYECAKVVYHTDSGRQIAVIVLPETSGEDAAEGARFYLITNLYDQQKRQDYAFTSDFGISFEEIERLARAGNE